MSRTATGAGDRVERLVKEHLGEAAGYSEMACLETFEPDEDRVGELVDECLRVAWPGRTAGAEEFKEWLVEQGRLLELGTLSFEPRAGCGQAFLDLFEEWAAKNGTPEIVVHIRRGMVEEVEGAEEAGVVVSWVDHDAEAAA